MTFLVDSGFLYATFDKNDDNHQAVVALLPSLSHERLIVPTLVLVEVAYLLNKRIGHQTMRHLLQVLKDGPLHFEYVAKQDLGRIYQILEYYADAKLDFVDASIVALAERLGVRKILTVDQRDFRIIHPKHCDYFEIFP